MAKKPSSLRNNPTGMLQAFVKFFPSSSSRYNVWARASISEESRFDSQQR